MNPHPQKPQDKILESTIARAKQKLFDLAESNPDMKVMLTLTYAKPGLTLSESYYNLMLFKKKLRYYYPNIKYLITPELQIERYAKRKEYAIHYHLLLNQVIEKSSENFYWIQDKLWKKGYIFFSNPKGHIDKPAYYISKYLGKQFLQEVKSIRPKHKQFYYASRNLNKPAIFYGYFADISYHFYSSKLSTTEHRTYETPYTGKVKVIKGHLAKEDFNLILANIKSLHYPQNNAILKSISTIKQKTLF